MIRIKKESLLIGCLALILGILLFFPDTTDQTEPKETFFEEAERSAYPKLAAPERQITVPEKGEKLCFLTFDDGPSRNTEKVLEILERYQIKATFFVIGDSITDEMLPVLERMKKEGHAVGMHANVHDYRILYESMESFLADYDALYAKLKEKCGIETALFRLPGGSACSCLNGRGKEYIREMERRGFACFDWKSSGEDAVGTPSVRSIQKNVFDTGFRYDRTIVLLHDSAMADKTVEALPAIIERFLREGYSFRSLQNAESYIFPDSR